MGCSREAQLGKLAISPARHPADVAPLDEL